MNILMMPNEKILATIGIQPVFANKDYRFTKYCLVTNVNGGKVIFNGLTRSCVFITDEELTEVGNINKYEFLYKNYFLVLDNFDEQKVVDEYVLKARTPIDDVYLDHPSSFTILTTTKCNARCYYCYELGSKNKHHMTTTTAEKVANYIDTIAPLSNQINLHWFGGEPLVNMKIIDLIVGKMRDVGRAFTTTFTTNGYLFNKDLIVKAKNIWNTVNVQITIDGTEDTYNKIKNYVNPEYNPYKKILNNIAILLNNGIQVIIRLNLNNSNSDNLKQLVGELHQRFGNHPNLSIYAWPIFDDERYTRSIQEHIDVFKKLSELEDVLDQYGYYDGIYPQSDIQYYQCMADDGNSIIIDPDGNIGTCEHFIDSHFFSHIDNPSIKNMEELKAWRLYEKPLDICADCPLYPSCVRPSQCQEMSKCDPYYKEWRIRKHIQGLRNFYNKATNSNLNQELPRRLAENIN